MSELAKNKFGWVKWILIGIVILILSGLVYKDYLDGQVARHSEYRFNMAVIVPNQGVTFASFDPSEKTLMVLPFPTNLSIQSRASGEYSISSMYKLGEYKGDGGNFARQKIQGFMRVPVPGYLVLEQSKNLKIDKIIKRGLLLNLMGMVDTSLSKMDSLYLLWRATTYSMREVGEDELIRAAVIEKVNNTDKFKYHPDRLQEYVGTRLFDWGIGSHELTVAIVNESGVNGLGSDLADFLTNLGLDVVMVRSNDKEIIESSEWQVASVKESEELGFIFQNLFGFTDPIIRDIPGEYRSSVVIRVGKDAIDLF